MQELYSMGWQQLKTLTLQLGETGVDEGNAIVIPDVESYRKYILAIRGVSNVNLKNITGMAISPLRSYPNGVRIFGPFSPDEVIYVSCTLFGGSQTTYVTPLVSTKGELDEFPVHPLPVANAVSFHEIQVVNDIPNDGDVYVYDAGSNVWAPGQVGGEVRQLCRWTADQAKDALSSADGGPFAMPALSTRNGYAIASFNPDVIQAMAFDGIWPYDWDGRNIFVRLYWTTNENATAYDCFWFIGFIRLGCLADTIVTAVEANQQGLIQTANSTTGTVNCAQWDDYEVPLDGGEKGDPQPAQGGDFFRMIITRRGSSVSDTLDVDAQLLGASIWTAA